MRVPRVCDARYLPRCVHVGYRGGAALERSGGGRSSEESELLIHAKHKLERTSTLERCISFWPKNMSDGGVEVTCLGGIGVDHVLSDTVGAGALQMACNTPPRDQLSHVPRGDSPGTPSDSPIFHGRAG